MFNNKIILKSQHRFKSDCYNVYTWQINKTIRDCKHLIKLQHIYMEQAHSKYVKYKIINFDDYANENKTEHNLKWLYIPDHPYRILIIGGSWSGKTNVLLNIFVR